MKSIEGSGFICQHGPAECYLNTITLCVVYILAGNSDERVEYVNCEMEMPFVNNTNSQLCRNKSEDMVITDGGLGYQVQVDAERITHKIAKPYQALVPTIVYNSVFDGKRTVSLFSLHLHYSRDYVEKSKSLMKMQSYGPHPTLKHIAHRTNICYLIVENEISKS